MDYETKEEEEERVSPFVFLFSDDGVTNTKQRIVPASKVRRKESI